MNIDNPYKELAETQKLLILIHEAALKDCDKETEELEGKVDSLQKRLDAVSTNDAKIVADLRGKLMEAELKAANLQVSVRHHQETVDRLLKERDKLKATLAYGYVQEVIVERDAARRERDNLKALWAQAESNGRALNGSD